MPHPSFGYDDETIVPEQRMKRLLDQLEKNLQKIEKVFRQYHPHTFSPHSEEIHKEMKRLFATAEELGSQYPFLIQKLSNDYALFLQTADASYLKQVFKDIKSLQLLLV